jgi:hypothetical protein
MVTLSTYVLEARLKPEADVPEMQCCIHYNYIDPYPTNVEKMVN